MQYQEITIEVGISSPVGSHWVKAGTRITVTLDPGEDLDSVFSELWDKGKSEVKTQLEEAINANRGNKP